METIKDPSEISQHLVQLKRASESGYYAKVTDIALVKNDESDVIELTLDYPTTGGIGAFRVTVPEIWEEGRRLATILDALDVDVENIGELENRSIPISRESGSWEVDMDRLEDGDYLEKHSYTQTNSSDSSDASSPPDPSDSPDESDPPDPSDSPDESDQ